jgi:hypothetical protein
MNSENKFVTSCFIIKKISQPGLNTLPIDVYEDKKSTKPIFKVYGNCKKNTNLGLSNNLILYLKEDQEI